jgi:hypothetical protein
MENIMNMVERIRDRMAFDEGEEDMSLSAFITEVASRDDTIYDDTKVKWFCDRVYEDVRQGKLTLERIDELGNFVPNWRDLVIKPWHSKNGDLNDILNYSADLEALDETLIAWISEANVTTPGKRLPGTQP